MCLKQFSFQMCIPQLQETAEKNMTSKQNIHVKGWRSQHFSLASVRSNGAPVKLLSPPMEPKTETNSLCCFLMGSREPMGTLSDSDQVSDSRFAIVNDLGKISKYFFGWLTFLYV